MGAEEIRALKEASKLPKPKKIYRLPKKSKKKLEQEGREAAAKGDNTETDLQKWYTTIMQSEMPICWETGEKIDTRDRMGWHGSIAHILPKEHYPSVKTHPMNYMILKMWGGTHGQYDSSWENASKMSVWKYALKTIIDVLYPLLTPEEKRKLPDCIIQEIPPTKFNQ